MKRREQIGLALARANQTERRRNPEPLHLVACGSSKLDHAAPARELYTGDLFQKARAYVEARGARWFILSAVHGLVDPLAVLEPYDCWIGAQDRAWRDDWGQRIAAQLERHERRAWPFSAPIVALAGKDYREPLERAGIELRAPMAGLAIGLQKAWLASHT